MLRTASRSVALGLVLGLSAGVYAQELNLKPRLSADRAFSYTLAMSLDVQQNTGADPERLLTRSGANADIRVVEVREDGSATIEVRFARARVEAPIEGAVSAFEWPEPDGQADPSSALAKILGGAAVRATVSPAGQVSVQSGLEDFVAAVDKLELSPADRERLKGIFTPATLAATLTPIFRVGGAGEAPRQMGKGWQTTDTVLLPPVAAIEITSDLSVTEVQGSTVTIAGPMNLTLLRPETAGDGVATVTMRTGSGGVQAGFDTDKGLVTNYRASMTIGTIWTLGDVRVEQDQNSFITARLLEN